MELMQDWQAEDAQRIADIGVALNAMHQIAAGTILPRPCNGPLYDKCNFTDYISKMREEVAEIEDAYKHIDYKDGATIDHLFLECTDLITVVTSAMESAGCGEKQRQVYQGMVNSSNAVRDGGRRVRK
jgi:hypothetical protein